MFGDLGVKDINKAHAIDVLLEHLGAKRSDTIAFGDAKIDIPMLEYCEVGVAWEMEAQKSWLWQT